MTSILNNIFYQHRRRQSPPVTQVTEPTRLFVAGSNATPGKGSAYYDLIDSTWHALADMPANKFKSLGDYPGTSHLSAFSNKIAFMGCEGSNQYLYVYDVLTNIWSPFDVNVGYDYCSCGEVLSGGRYLVGWQHTTGYTFIYDPVTNTTSHGTSPGNIEYQLSCTLASGKILEIGIYDAVTHIFTDNGGSGSWTTGASLSANHTSGGIIRLADGRLLHTGTSVNASCSDPAVSVWGVVTNAPGDMSRSQGVVLPDSRVVFAGGALRKIYIYTPGAWTSGDAPNLNAGTWATSTNSTVSESYMPTVLYSAFTKKVYIVGGSNHISVWNPVTDTIADLVIPVDLNINLPLGILY